MVTPRRGKPRGTARCRPGAGPAPCPPSPALAAGPAPAVAPASLSKLQALSAETIRAREAERLRIARELHDGVSPLIGAAKLELDRLALNAREGHPITEADLLSVSAQLSRIYEEVRAMARALRPPALESVGLEPALRAALEEFEKRTGVKARFVERGGGPRLPLEVEVNLYRVAQEALSNVARHAAARHVVVTLERGRRSVLLAVEDDGRGFVARAGGGARAARTLEGGLGLIGMEERARLLGGAARFIARPGRGTRIEVEVPITEVGETGRGEGSATAR